MAPGGDVSLFTVSEALSTEVTGCISDSVATGPSGDGAEEGSESTSLW